MNKDNTDITVGNYTAEVSSSKTSVVKSDILPIYKGIKIYPLRYGIYKSNYNKEELSHIGVSQSEEGNYTIVDARPRPFAGDPRTTNYPDLRTKDLYSYFSMPLRDGWLYMVSANVKGIYEYRHLDYRYKLYSLYLSGETRIFPTNTTWQPFLQCADNDKVYMFYSEVRLEESFLRSRLFSDRGLRIRFYFDVRKWLDKNNVNYKTDIRLRRMAVKDVNVSFINDPSVQSADFREVIEYAVNDLNNKNANTKTRDDIFFVVDDVMGLGKQLIEDIKYKHVELQGLVKSIQTGIPLEKVLERFSSLDSESIKRFNSLSNKELFPDVDCEEVEYMHTMALLLKNFFFEMEIPEKEKDLKKYIKEGRGEINEKTLNGILGIDLREEMCKHIDEHRGVLHYYLRSNIFRNYCRFFLDKEEYPNIENEDKLPFVIPQKFTYDFFKEGPTYNAMIAQVVELVGDLYETLSLSPYRTDMYLTKKEDPYRSAIEQIETLSGEKPEAALLLNKELIGIEYFENKQLVTVASFFHKEEFPGWQTFYSMMSILGSTLDVATNSILKCKTQGFIQWDLTQGTHKTYSLTNRGNVEKNIKYSVVVENDKSLLVRVSKPEGNVQTQQIKFPESPDVQVMKTKKGSIIKIKGDAYNAYTVTAEGKFILNIDVLPRANWSAVKDPAALAKYVKLKSIDILNRIQSSRCFGIAMPMLSFYIISQSLQDPDRHSLRKANDVVMNLAILGAMSQNFLPKVMTEGFVKNPMANVKLYKKTFTARIPTSLIFRGFVVVSNICAGVEGVLQGRDLLKNGNIITGTITEVLGLVLLGASFVFVLGPMGWGVYLIITILASIIMFVVGLFVDSNLELFLQKTVFHLDYVFQYTLKDTLSKKMNAISEDIRVLAMDKNKTISHSEKKRFMENFKFQLDELTMVYLFAPSFQQCSFTPSYRMMRYTPQQYDTMSGYPSEITISITGQLSFLLSMFETIELNAYFSTKNEPNREDLNLLSNYKGATECLSVGGLFDDRCWPDSYQKPRVKQEPGAVDYVFSVIADIGCRDHRKLSTYPFFLYDEYFLFLYIRIKLKDGKWMPANRTPETHYLKYRYRLVRQIIEKTPHNRADYTITADKIEICPLPYYKNLK